MMSSTRRFSRTPRKGPRAKVSRVTSVVSIDPIPPILTSLVTGHTFRYLATNVSTLQSVSKAQLLNNMFVNAASGVTNYGLIKSMKINKISLWCSTPIIGTGVGTPNTTCSLEWASTAGPNRLITDSALGASAIAKIISNSPPRSLASFWFDTGINESDVMFFVSAIQGAIMDVSVSITVGEDVASRTITTAATGTAGLTYYSYLDGPRVGAIWQPQGFLSLN